MDKLNKRFINSNSLPLVIEPEDRNISLSSFLSLLKEQNSEIKKDLLKHGGILFRNFPLRNAQDFLEVIYALNTGKFIDYVGGDSPRTKILEGIYTSTEAPPSIKIPLHNELSYAKNYPSHIYFFCETAPINKGETIIADARAVYRSMDEKVRQRFIDKNLKYFSHYYNSSPFMKFFYKHFKAHKSWTNVFETSDPSEVEKKCRDNDLSFEWNHKDWIEISQIRPATITHPKTGEPVWFNQAHIFDFTPRLCGFWYYLAVKLLYCRRYMRLHEVYFADGTPIPRDDLYHILDVLDANTIFFPWHTGDLLLLDNILTMHGRNTFKGKRRVLTAMTGE